MLGQGALLIDLARCTAQHLQLDDCPEFVGALDALLDIERLCVRLPARPSPADVFVLGVGPLAGTPVPGCNQLAIACQSPMTGEAQLATLAGAGLVVENLGCSPILLHGRAPKPGALLIYRSGNGTIEVRVESTERCNIGRGSGVLELAHALHTQLGNDDMTMILTGPAARTTAYGALLLVQRRAGQLSPILDNTLRGGLGSALHQRHGLYAICVASNRPVTQVLRDASALPQLDQRLAGRLTVAELEHAAELRFDARLVRGGPLLRELERWGPDLLCFNANSIYWSMEQRETLYRQVTCPRLIEPLDQSLRHNDARQLDCGAPCPLNCRRVSHETLRDFETHALLGPQLGIFDRVALDPLVQRCLQLGFDATTVGNLLAWLFERLARHQLEPAAVGMAQRPSWPTERPDQPIDSRHNAQVAMALLDGLIHADWSASLRSGLRAATRSSGPAAASWALVLATGDGGEAAPAPVWALGTLVPSPMPGEALGCTGRHFLPPRELGRQCAKRLTAELALANHGLCSLHRVWLEARYPELLAQLYHWPDRWLTHHRRLARRLAQARTPQFWVSQRVMDLAEQRLRLQQLDGAADAELDRWVRRFAHGAAAAARAFWAESLAGLKEELSA